jgi:hypothetical protein
MKESKSWLERTKPLTKSPGSRTQAETSFRALDVTSKARFLLFGVGVGVVIFFFF